MQQAFYKQQAMPFREEEYDISKRFQKDGTPLLWRLKAMSQLENEEFGRKADKIQNNMKEWLWQRSCGVP